MTQSSLLKNVLFLAIVAAIVGGTTPVAAKIALEGFPPFTLILIRFVCGAIILLPFVIYTGQLKLAVFRKSLPIAILGAINPILFFVGLQYTQASVSPLIFATVPALTALYFYSVLGERLSKRQTLGIVLGLVGVMVIVLLPLFTSALAASALLGNAILAVATVFFAAYGIVSKHYQRSFDTSPLVIVFYLCIAAIGISVPFAVSELLSGASFVFEGPHIAAALFVGTIGTGLFYIVHQYGVRFGSEVSAALFTYIQPVATILLASLFLSEQLTLPFFIGGVLAVVGAQLASKK